MMLIGDMGAMVVKVERPDDHLVPEGISLIQIAISERASASVNRKLM